MWSPPSLPDAPSLPSTDALAGAPPRGSAALIGGGTPTAICNDGRPELPLEEMTIGPAALSNGRWSVNRPLCQTADGRSTALYFGYCSNHPSPGGWFHALGSRTAVSNSSYRTYHRLKLAGSYRQFKRRLETTFDKV
jgi:hypothetical protein